MPGGHFVLRRGRRAGALAAAVLAATLALTGCTTFDKTSTAAFVNGTAISDATVAQVTNQFNDNLASTADQKLQEAQALQMLILAPFVLNQVKASGSWTPDARYNTALQKIPDASQATKDFLATSIILQQGGPLTDGDVTAILDQLKKADVVLDPRFGTWDPNTGAFLAAENNWIKPTAAPTLEPAPSPTETSTGTPTGTATGQ
ncbi:MAG TPA: hypothetical protein VI110_06970 [Lapillicoccus sp.]